MGQLRDFSEIQAELFDIPEQVLVKYSIVKYLLFKVN